MPQLLDQLIPMEQGKNPELSIAKYAARIALFDSQTLPVSMPAAIAWGEFTRETDITLLTHLIQYPI